MSPPHPSTDPRPALDARFIRATVARWFTPVWFAAISALQVVPALASGGPDPGDARLYVAAARAWLSGDDPWAVGYHGVYFAAPPPCLLPVAPFALLPDPAGWASLTVVAVLAALLTIRMLQLPPWWILFPPLVNGALAGNPQLLLIPLLLGPAAWLAAIIKPYALVPIVIAGRWRQVMIAGLLLVATAPLLPWGTYIDDLGVVTANLADQSRYGFSAVIAIVLAAPVAVALFVIGRDRATWLAVPALWPAQQWYYGTLALPSRSRLACSLIALPVPASGTLAVIALALYELAWRARGVSASSLATTEARSIEGGAQR